MSDKRKRLIISAVCIIIALITILVCFIGNLFNKNIDGVKNSPTLSPDNASFAVYYLDVGQSDCIYIHFPDGKNMLIDTGEEKYTNKNYLQEFFTSKKINRLDYFLLTHTDIDHIGNAHYFLDNFQIGKMFVPYVSQASLKLFPEFDDIMKKVNEKQIDFAISDYYHNVVGKDYALAFLSPLPKDSPSGAYNDLNSTQEPSDTQKNNVSPIIYLECFGARFVFTGDAQSASEKFVVERYKSGLYNHLHKDKVQVNLENIDYLKLGHHGSDDASCNDFLSLLQPKNVIISVGKDNYYGHPSSDMFMRLDELNLDYGLYRTDTNGTICVKYIDNEFQVQVDVQ
ncbi:MAG: MBL fold metallo-hydrolase [Clostridiales bacterium]|nr:MBL fold metallo-hydrolase [Clostridiales bacterium]